MGKWGGCCREDCIERIGKKREYMNSYNTLWMRKGGSGVEEW